MKKIILILFTGIIIFSTTLFTSCGSSKSIVAKGQNAEKYYNSGDYQSALNIYNDLILSYEKSGKEKECPFYSQAGFAALKLNKIDKALEYFKKAEYSNFVNEETYIGLADCYKAKNNLSKEMMSLQDYVSKYPNGKYIKDVKKRLFSIYVESENYDKALLLWPEIQAEASNDSVFLIKYFKANIAVGNNEVCDSLSPVIMDFHPQNVEALEWEAKKYYNKAENLYQQEMKAYEKNRTNKQYKQLLNALNVVNADYKKALDYYLKLYKINPKRKYAIYISNIYSRFDDKEKASYYKKKAK